MATELHKVLRKFQRQGVRGIYRFKGRALLADEQGLGKTLQALEWIRLIIKSCRPALIICPASVKYNWQAEALLHFGMRVEVIEGHYKKGKRLPSGDVLVINYDLLRSWLPVLYKFYPKIVVIDEAQFITNPNAQRTKATMILSAEARSVVALSGTPLTNRPIELWSVLQCVNPDIFPSMQKYAWRYCRPRYDIRRGWLFNGSKHEDELHHILKTRCMIRRLKKDVLPELPPKIRKTSLFKLSPSDYREYREAESQFLSWLRKQSPVRAKRAAKNKHLVQIGYLLRLVAKLKLPWTIRWIEEFLEANPGKKLVCFTMHTFVIDRLMKHFGRRAVVVDGRVTGRKRTETVRRFQSNRSCDLFFGQWKAAGVGITLTAAHNVAALDFPWTPADLLQGEDRIHRIGQKFRCVIHYLAALMTMEEHQIQIQHRKSKILDAILNGHRPAKDLDIFSELLRVMRMK